MSYHRSRRHRSSTGSRPLVAFLLIASFGILFAGCSNNAPQEQTDEFTFTEMDVARFRELAQEAQQKAASGILKTEPELLPTSEDQEIPVLDLSVKTQYDALRNGPDAVSQDMYVVTNDFLNVRSEPRVTASQVENLTRGDMMTVTEFIDAAWAKVALPSGAEGYVAHRYIAKLVSEEDLATEKEKFKDLYFVDFAFLNVRKSADTNSEKIGELPGQSFVRPLNMDTVWARVPFEDGEGYVAVQYLKPFLPNFLIRQNRYTLPIVHFSLLQEGVLDAMPRYLAALQQAGLSMITLSEFRDILLAQRDKDVRLDPNTIVVAISDITSDTVSEVSDTLRVSNVSATLFLQTQYLGLDGITERSILNLMANGNDLQSGTHMGDDLRSLTNAQLELELKQSRKLLQDMTKKDVFAVGYPRGGSNDRVVEAAANAGYLFGVTARSGRTFARNELLTLPSITVTADLSEEALISAVKGE